MAMSSDREWLAGQLDNLTTELAALTPTQWAEEKRYLPPSVTSLPGYYRTEVAPYVKEITDCFSPDSPIREVTVMKGTQLCLTTALENVIGYMIDHVRTSPVMFVTADQELAKIRLESYILPMLQLSGLDHLIQSSDWNNGRKTGKTDKKLEWLGGGFLIPFGAQNANKLRSIPIQILLRDEIDGWPDVVGKDGDPVELSASRTAGYEGSRKILDISTPTIAGKSKIDKRFKRGDQRYYFVCCLKCGYSQRLRWRVADNENGNGAGVVTGMAWETQGGILVPDSVRYLCANCSHEHFNDDKTRLLAPENGAEWRPTALPQVPDHRSYHLNALYSPVGMQTWFAHVAKFLEAFDPETNRARDLAKLQVWYNNTLGKPFALQGERVPWRAVSMHRRAAYKLGDVPNRFARQFCGGPVALLVCSVDVHKDRLKVAVFGWCRDLRAVLIDYQTFEGDTERTDDPGTWRRLADLIDEKVYQADDGTGYRLQLTLIDSGYRASTVYDFCLGWQAGVNPIKGREVPPKAALIKEWSAFEAANGVRAFGITVDLYKDRIAANLRNEWDGVGLQPAATFNAPENIGDDELKELTVEFKVERTDKQGGFAWQRPAGAANELWDCYVYAYAAIDMIAHDVCIEQKELPVVDWDYFFDLCDAGDLSFKIAQPQG